MKIIRRRVKNPRIDLRGDEIVLILPPGMDPNDVLESKRDWIEKKLEEKKRILQEAEKGLEGGIPILDVHYRIIHDCKRTGVYPERKEIRVCKKRSGYLKEKLREMLREDMERRVKRWGAELGLKPNRIFIKEQKTKWGSCSSRRNLSFNFNLLFTPEEFREYIAIHEVLHLKHPNHGAEFKEELKRMYGKDIPSSHDMLVYWYRAEIIKKNLKL